MMNDQNHKMESKSKEYHADVSRDVVTSSKTTRTSETISSETSTITMATSSSHFYDSTAASNIAFSLSTENVLETLSSQDHVKLGYRARGSDVARSSSQHFTQGYVNEVSGEQETGFSLGGGGAKGTERQVDEDAIREDDSPAYVRGSLEIDNVRGPVVKVDPLHHCCSCLQRAPNRECVPKEIQHLQIPAEEYSAALHLLRDTAHVRYFTALHNRFLHASLFALVFLLIWMMGLVLQHHINSFPVEAEAALFFLLATMGVVIAYCCCYGTSRKAERACIPVMTKVNDLMSRHGLLLGLVNQGMTSCYTLSLSYVCHDITPCVERVTSELGILSFHRNSSQLEQLKARFLRQRSVDRGSVVMSSDTDVILDSCGISVTSSSTLNQEMAREVCLYYCDAWAGHMTNSIKLGQDQPSSSSSSSSSPSSSPGPAHVREGLCLCQYVLQKLRPDSETSGLPNTTPS